MKEVCNKGHGMEALWFCRKCQLLFRKEEGGYTELSPDDVWPTKKWTDVVD